MNSDIGIGYIIGNTVAKIKKFRFQINKNKDIINDANVLDNELKEKAKKENKDLQNELNKKIARAIYILRAKLVGDKFEKGKTSYRFNNKHFSDIHKALNDLCFKSYKHENEFLNAFIESIKNAVIHVKEA